MIPTEKTHGVQNDDAAPQSGFAHQGGATGHEVHDTDPADKPASTEPPRNLDTDRGGAYDRGNGGFTGGAGQR